MHGQLDISTCRVAIDSKDAKATSGRPSIEMFKIKLKDIRSGRKWCCDTVLSWSSEGCSSSPTCVQFFFLCKPKENFRGAEKFPAKLRPTWRKHFLLHR
jgi:hypothetical protein